jgi:phytoene synthase
VLSRLSSGRISPTGVLPTLLLSYAPPETRDWHRLAWVIDERLAHVVRTVREPAIAAIRMAWWREALAAHDLSKGKSEPLVEAWRAQPRNAAADQAVEQMINGWSVLADGAALTVEDMRAYAEGRGSGLFRLLTADGDSNFAEGLERAGALWALWDLAGHVSDVKLAAQAMDLAHSYADLGYSLPKQRGLRPLRLALGIAQRDVVKGHIPSGGFGPRHYIHLLWMGLAAG